MSFFQCFQLAVKNIMASKVRAILTMLGIIIGVGAVILIVGLGNGMEIYMTQSFQSMGTDTLTLSIYGRGSSRSVDVDDLYQLVEDNPEYLKALSPEVNAGNVKVGNESLSYTSALGVGEDYASIKKYEMAQGRFLQYVDILKRNKVCVVGSYVNQEYYGGDALGKTIRINGNVFTIIGVLEVIGDNTEHSTDNQVLLPYSTAAKLSWGSINSYTFQIVSEDTVSQSKLVIEDYLTEAFGGDSAYQLISMSEILDTMTQMLNVMITILAAIAAISLVVGGIGIMNIMLVSVSERTREIGIRKALGAKQRHILSQFVIEAATTSAIGGVLGILLGYGMSSIATFLIVNLMQEDLAVIPSSSSVIGAFAISAAIGILFGYLPARKAARLNPIEALRYD
ncbi:MAG: FtsX-like permease family protein [Oscillospiraceae bacterium]|jgi:putative ABC transport system permease protein|nr:FtsX-like permease family protein [Oscillospiraceae bacterium]